MCVRVCITYIQAYIRMYVRMYGLIVHVTNFNPPILLRYNYLKSNLDAIKNHYHSCFKTSKDLFFLIE